MISRKKIQDLKTQYEKEVEKIEKMIAKNEEDKEEINAMLWLRNGLLLRKGKLELIEELEK